MTDELGPRQTFDDQRVLMLGAIAVVLIALTGGLVFVVLDRGNEQVRTVAPPTTVAPLPTIPATVTTIAPETAPTLAGGLTAPDAVWPVASSSQRFDDPVAAVTDFATTFVGFGAPVVGPFLADAGLGDAGSVEVRPREDGPVTTVRLRRTDTWWITGASTETIVVDQPTALTSIVSPVTLQGRAAAFEGTVNVEIRGDGQLEPLAGGYVTGRGDGQLGEFSSSLEFTPPADGTPLSAGSVVFTTPGGEAGEVWVTTVVRVYFAEVTPG